MVLVSCILVTKDRPAFARQALRCYLGQTYAFSELIVVDDGEKSVESIFRNQPRVRYIRLAEPSTIGKKLNLGIEQARGTIIQKLDDDDYYHPDFLHRAVSALGESPTSVVAWDCFLVLIHGDMSLRFSGHGYAAGGTLCFRRALWETVPFRDVCVGEDWEFLNDAHPALTKICAPEMYILVRHGGNCWSRHGDVSVNDMFREKPAYAKPLDAIVSAEDLDFYRHIQKHGAPAADLIASGGQVVPRVSCLMPTRDRRPFIPQALRQFLDQDYPDRELVVVDDGCDPIADLLPPDLRIRYIRSERVLALGAKRNLAAEKASGEILVHWDDDDWMAPWRLSYQVQSLLEAGTDACGAANLYFHDPAADRAWEYRYSGARPWVAGGTLCYTRGFWNDHRFAEIGEGEDNDFVWRHGPRLLQQADNSFYVATVHSGNTSRKVTTGPEWRPVPLSELPHRRNPSADSGLAPRLQLPPDIPLISCLMPTGGREAFARQAIRYFLRQTYPNKELVIVDDPGGGLAGQIPADDRIRYLQPPHKLTLGTKLNMAIEASRGLLVAHWDDDDWYSPSRLQVQAQAFLNEEADICAPRPGFLFDIAAGRFWACSPELWEKIFAHGVILGAGMMYSRRLWEDGPRHPDMTFPEDLLFLRSVLARGGKLLKIANDGIFVCVRHSGNTWRFTCGQEGGPQVWQTASVPGFLPVEDLAFYCQLGVRPGKPPQHRPLAESLSLHRAVAPQPRSPGVARSRVVVRKMRL